MAIFNGDNEIIGIINYKVGDKVREHLHTRNVLLAEEKTTKGEVVYVHPYGRFYTVEFNLNGVKIKESYTVRSDVNPCRLSWFG